MATQVRCRSHDQTQPVRLLSTPCSDDRVKADALAPYAPPAPAIVGVIRDEWGRTAAGGVLAELSRPEITPLCTACLALASRLPLADTRQIIEQLQTRSIARVHDNVCSICERPAPVVSLSGVARPISGGSNSDVGEIAGVIRAAALCTTCIGRRIGVLRRDVDAALKDIRRSLAVIATVARCEACLKQTVVHRLR
jgi:hypothetical protein